MNGFDIAAILTIDSSQFDRGLAKAKGAATSFGSGVGGVLGKVGRAAKIGFAAAGVASVGFAATAAKTGANFDKAMSQVAATMGKTNEELSKEVGSVDTQFGHFSGTIRDFAKYMGKNTKFSATQAADALNYMALAGYDTQKSMNMLPNVLNLAAAGNMGLAEASDMVTDAQSALGLSTKETTELVDKMAMAASKSNTSVSQLGEAILTVGGTAKNLKGGTTELAQALGILADNGIKGSEGGTALRNVLLGIQSKKFEKTFGELGVNAFDAQGKARSLKDVFADMNKVMDGMTVEEKSKLIASAFNRFDLKSVNALLGTNAQRWDELAGSIDNAHGSAAKMAETQLDNLEGDVTILKSAFEGLQITVSEKLNPVFRQVVQAATHGISAINDLFEGIDSDKVKSIGDLFSVAIVGAINKLPSVLSGISGLLRGAIISLVDEGGSGIGSAIASAFSKIGPEMANNFGVILDQLVTLRNLLIQKVGEMIPEVLSAIGEAIPGAIASVGSMFDSLVSVGAEMMGKIAEGLPQGIPKLFEQIMPMLSSLSGKIREGAGTLVDAGLNLLLKLAQGIANGLPTLIQNIPTIVSNIAGIINDNMPKILTTGVQIIIALVKGIISAIPTLIANIPQILKAIVDVFMAFSWLNLGKVAISGISKGLEGAVGIIKGAMGKVRDGIVDGIKGAVGKVTGIVKRIKSAFNFGGIAGKVRSAFNAVKTAITHPITTAKNTVTKLINKVKGLFPLKIGKVFSGIKLPHFNVSGGSPPYGLMGKGKKPSFSVSWNRKAMDNPWMFTGATLFGAGEAGDEVMYGKAALMRDIEKAVGKGMAIEVADLSDDIEDAFDFPQTMVIKTDTVKDGGRLGQMLDQRREVTINAPVTVDGAENPEQFATRFVRQLDLEMRTV